MPIYEYRCKKCGYKFEVVAHIKDAPPTQCPSIPKEGEPPCDGEIERLISLTSFSLQGGGWASDGYSGGKS